MKFLVTMKPINHVMHRANAEQIDRMNERLHAAVGGDLVAAFGLVSGGAVYVFECGSNEELAHILRRMPLWRTSEVDVQPLVDIDFLLDLHRRR